MSRYVILTDAFVHSQKKLEEIMITPQRHTFALLGLQAGTDNEHLQDNLGYKIQTILNKYSHVNEEIKLDVAYKRSQIETPLIQKTN